MTTLTIDEPPPSECLGLPLCDWRRKIGELFGLLSRAGVHGIVFEFAGYWKDVKYSIGSAFMGVKIWHLVLKADVWWVVECW